MNWAQAFEINKIIRLLQDLKESTMTLFFKTETMFQMPAWRQDNKGEDIVNFRSIQTAFEVPCRSIHLLSAVLV